MKQKKICGFKFKFYESFDILSHNELKMLIIKDTDKKQTKCLSSILDFKKSKSTKIAANFDFKLKSTGQLYHIL